MKTNDIEKISLKLGMISCENNLENKIIKKIEKAQRREARIKLEFFGFSFFVITGICISVFSKVWADFQNSVFYEYASILFSDTRFALTNWKPTLLLLVESAPILDIFLIVTIVGVVLYLLSKTTKEASIFLQHKLIYPQKF